MLENEADYYRQNRHRRGSEIGAGSALPGPRRYVQAVLVVEIMAGMLRQIRANGRLSENDAHRLTDRSAAQAYEAGTIKPELEEIGLNSEDERIRRVLYLGAVATVKDMIDPNRN